MTMRHVTALVAAGIACAVGVVACRPHLQPELTCPPAEEAFTQESRLGAMLAVHAYAYFAGEVEANGRGPHGLVVKPLPDAIRVLRCDPEPVALSRRRRAIAKLLAYDWPGERYKTAITTLGGDIPAIVDGIESEVMHTELAQYLRDNRAVLEFLILRLTARKPSLIRVRQASAGGPTQTPTPTMPTITPTPPANPPPVVSPTVTATPPGIILGAPVGGPVNVCAQGWQPESKPHSYESSGIVHSFAYISVPGHVRDLVARNVDPQSWDECSTFWPRPAISGNPPDSATLANVSASGCMVTFPAGVQPTAVPAGSLYPLRDFYEHFRCVTPPCDSEFKNILNVYTDHQPRDVGGTTVTAYHMHYSLPVCGFRSSFDGAISGRVQSNTSVLTSVDTGTIDVWDAPGASPRTHIQADKHVAFTSITYTNTLAAILKYTELNEQLAEIVCCRKSWGP